MSLPTFAEMFEVVCGFAARLPGRARSLVIDLGEGVEPFRCPLGIPIPPGGTPPPGILAFRSPLVLKILLSVCCSEKSVTGERIAELAGECHGNALKSILADLADPAAGLLASGPRGYALRDGVVEAGVTAAAVWSAMPQAARHTITPALRDRAEAAGLVD